MSNVLGVCVLTIMALAFELIQQRRERKQNDALYSLKRQTESLADTIRKNGGLKARK